ncbi:MAG TPA: hypothetical protein VNB64_00140, partial [Solirubrobacteraceae bacterium]|nr:hypothetical protein [Solirubrobacteraceae bacterium]
MSELFPPGARPDGDREGELPGGGREGEPPVVGTGGLIARGLAAVRGHPRHLVLAALVAGLLAAPAPLAVAAACLVAAGVGWTGGARRVLPWLAVVAVLAGAVVSQERVAALERTVLGPHLGEFAILRGHVLEHPRAPAGASAPQRSTGEGWTRGRSTGGRSAFVAIAAGPGVGERVVVSGRWPAVPLGGEVVVEGRLVALRE